MDIETTNGKNPLPRYMNIFGEHEKHDKEKNIDKDEVMKFPCSYVEMVSYA
jgi:hypothetical protein